jgi:hypothetical protein
MAIYDFLTVRDEVVRACQPHSGRFGLSNTVTMRTPDGEIAAAMQGGKIMWWLNGRVTPEEDIARFIEEQGMRR